MSTSATRTTPAFQTLSGFSSCEVSDALVKLGLPHGGHIPDIHLLSPVDPKTRICGSAYTVKMVTSSDTSAPRLEKHFVDTATPESVIVIDTPADTKSAVWGGLMTAGAKSRKCLGVVISGRARDLAEHLEQDFPVFARSQSTLGQSPFTRPSEINIPITIYPQPSTSMFPPVLINPGDIILADRDGVVCVPQSLENRVVELATRGREIDAKCLEEIKAGNSIKETFQKWRGR
ncbi:hypothetical protein Clacol_000589 [Clathrus columnatus]|uniref:RraA-like protein n=1 Tax=Clathrus columnatus TaxID=1419009 RepID=A0AAV4ZZP3_9AGAM|nr:hypothetical protein Clacol_000589 [Clathrus columnatus]